MHRSAPGRTVRIASDDRTDDSGGSGGSAYTCDDIATLGNVAEAVIAQSR